MAMMFFAVWEGGVCGYDVFNECVSDFREIKVFLKYLRGSCPDESH